MSLPNESTSATYGAPFQDATPVEDPTTDQSAAQANQFMADVAAMTHVVDRAYVVITTSATTPTVIEHNANWGNANAVIPTVSRTGVGVFSIAWPTTVTGEDGASYVINFKRVKSVINEGPLRGYWTATVVGSRTVTLNLFDTTNAASDLAGQNFVITVR